MAVAHSPLPTAESSVPEAPDRFTEALADAIAAGRTPGEIARRMAPNDPHRRKQIRARVRNMLYSDDQLAIGLAKRARAQHLMDLVPTARAVGARARRGRIDAAKLVYEVTSFHNPRVQHEHSGDIKISLTIPRPTHEPKAIDVPEADVVEED